MTTTTPTTPTTPMMTTSPSPLVYIRYCCCGYSRAVCVRGLGRVVGASCEPGSVLAQSFLISHKPTARDVVGWEGPRETHIKGPQQHDAKPRRCDAMRCDAMKKSVIHPSTPTQARTLILTLAHSRPHASRIPEKDKTSSLITPPREAGLLDAGQSEHDRTTRIGIECFTNVQGKRS